MDLKLGAISPEKPKILQHQEIVVYTKSPTRYIHIIGGSGTFTAEEVELIKTDFQNVCLVVDHSFILRPSKSAIDVSDVCVWQTSYSEQSPYGRTLFSICVTAKFSNAAVWSWARRDVHGMLPVLKRASADDAIGCGFKDGEIFVSQAELDEYIAGKLSTKLDKVTSQAGYSRVYAVSWDGKTQLTANLTTNDIIAASIPQRTGDGQLRAQTVADDHNNASDIDLVNRAHLRTKIAEVNEKLETFFAGADVSKDAIDTLLELQDYIKHDEGVASQIVTRIGELDEGLRDTKHKTTKLQAELTDVMNSLKQDIYDSETKSLAIRPSAVTIYNEDTKELTFLCPVLYDSETKSLKI